LVGAVTPAAQKWPTGHTAWEVRVSQYLPAGHVLACVEPAGHDCPARHAEMLEGVMHTNPSGQSSWVDDPAAQ
jgi:hypothetical protein